MSLESVFANPPPLVGEVNKDSTLYGENQSGDGVLESNETGEDDESPAKEEEEEEPSEEADLEEGEIIDDSEGESPDKVASDEPTSLPPPPTQDPPIPANENEIAEEDEDQDKKKRKKRGRRKERKEHERRDSKKRKKRKLMYVDHDRVDDGSKESFKLGERPSPYNTPPYPDSPMSDYDDSGKEDHYINGSRSRGSEINKRFKSSGRQSAKKKGNSQGGPPLKRKKRPALLQTPDCRRFCRFFLEGKCNKGSDCPFSHDTPPVKKNELCKFYLNSYCTKGDDCLYVHKKFPCKFFHTGAQCFQGDNCKFSHEPLNEETQKMLEQCLDIGQCDGPPDIEIYNNNNNNPRPSLLGSPPRHIKEAIQFMREHERKIPSLFDIEIQPPRSFYTDTLHSPNVSPQKAVQPPHLDPPVRPPPPLTSNNTDSNSPPQEGNTENSLPMEDFKDSEETEQHSTSGSESDSKKQNIEIPLHLPKKQRELFMRIQQHQHEDVQSGGSDAADKKNGDSDDNWYSSDDDDDDDGPLTDVLKKLQSQPVPPVKPPLSSNLVNSASDPSLSFNITQMLNVIRSASTTKGNVRDPRLINNVSGSNKDTSHPVNKKSVDSLPVNQMSYQLRAITITQANPADRLRLLKASHNDPGLQSDPRLQKHLSNANDTKPLDPRLEKNVFIDSKPQNPHMLKVPQTDRPQDPRLQKPIATENNRTTDPRLLKNIQIENKHLDPRLQRPAKPVDPRSAKVVDPRPEKLIDPRPVKLMDLRPQMPMDLRPPMPMDIRPPMPMDLRPAIHMDLRPPMPMDLMPPMPMDLRPPMPMDIRPPMHMNLRPPMHMNLRPPMPMNLRPPMSVELRPPMPLGLRSPMPMDIRPPMFVDPRSSISMDSRSVMSMDPRSAMSMDPRSAISMDPRSVITMDPRSVISIDPRSVKPVDPRSAKPLDPRSVKPIDPRPAKQADPRTVKPVDPRLARLPVSPENINDKTVGNSKIIQKMNTRSSDPRLIKTIEKPKTSSPPPPNDNNISETKNNCKKQPLFEYSSPLAIKEEPVEDKSGYNSYNRPRLLQQRSKEIIPPLIKTEIKTAEPGLPKSDNNVQISETKINCKKQPLFEYSSPLAIKEEPVEDKSGYNSYNRPRLLQQRPKEITPLLIKKEIKTEPGLPKSDNNVQISETKINCKKQPLFEYSSPLAIKEEPVEDKSGYNSYNRPRLLQQRPKEITPPLIKTESKVEPPPPTSEDLAGSLRDVFKTKDPTASPFC